MSAVAPALLFLAALAFIVWLFLRRQADTAPIQSEVLYDDTSRERVSETLVSHRYGLRGKPDYVVRTPHGPAPIEVKSRRCGRAGPRDSELVQLFAYCMLVEDVSGQPVHEGEIQFADRCVTVPFGPVERRVTLGVIEEMHRLLRLAADVPRNHRQAGKCRSCGLRADCGQALHDARRVR